MVRERKMSEELQVGDTVIIPWGLDEVRGNAVQVYGTPPRLQVVVELTPELSSYVVAEPTTVTLAIDAVRRAEVAA